MSDPSRIYFAGPLFDHKHLVGNALLAEQITRASGGRYRCVLPQDLEPASERAVDVRDTDLRHVMAADFALFGFDGSELDSGTVVEFVYAKLLDIPSVVLRTDFRAGGDQSADAPEDPWNLMCSFFPRTRVVKVNAMTEYQRARAGSDDSRSAAEAVIERVAGEAVAALDAIANEPALAEGDRALLDTLYGWAARFPGGGLEAALDAHARNEILARKLERGLQ